MASFNEEFSKFIECESFANLMKKYHEVYSEQIDKIEELGGEHVALRKVKLLQSWVAELLETVAGMCSTIEELEQVSLNAVKQLDIRLQDSAIATRAFMHGSAKNCDQNFGRELDSGVSDESWASMSQSPDGDDSQAVKTVCSMEVLTINDSDLPVDVASRLQSLQSVLAETQQALKDSEQRCVELQRASPSVIENRLQAELRDLQVALQTSEKERRDLERSIVIETDVKLQALQAEVLETRRALREAEERVPAEVEAQLLFLKSETNRMQKALQQSEQVCEDTKSVTNEMEKELIYTQSKLRMLEEQLQRSGEKYQKIEMKLELSERLLQRLQEDNKKIQNDSREILADSYHSSQQCSKSESLDEEKLRYRERMELKDADLSRQAEYLRTLQEQLQQAEEEVISLKNDLKEKDATLSASSKKHADYKEVLEQQANMTREKKHLQDIIVKKDAELGKLILEKANFEKLALNAKDKIVTLSNEVAAKHDAERCLQQKYNHLETKFKELEQLITFKDMVAQNLRRQNQSKSEDENVGRGDSETKKLPASSAMPNTNDISPNRIKHEECGRLERRLEELEVMIRAKDEIIFKMSSAQDLTSPRSQAMSALHQMGPEELKACLVRKEKENEEQRMLIGQLQDAVVGAKQKLEEYQGSNVDGKFTESGKVLVSEPHGKDDVIRALRLDLAEMEAQYSDCFAEVCRQNQQLHLLREANLHYQEKTKNLHVNLQQSRAQSKEHSNVPLIVCRSSNAQTIELELSIARDQLKKVENKNNELQSEIHNMKSEINGTEKQLEEVLAEKNMHLSERDNLISELQNKLLSRDDSNEVSSLTQDLNRLQNSITDGATLLSDKDLQIALLQDTLEQVCHEAEGQFKLLSEREQTLLNLKEAVEDITKERDALLSQIESMEIKQKEIAKLSSENGSEVIKSGARPKLKLSIGDHCKSALENEISSLKQQLTTAHSDIESWKQRYEFINGNLITKEEAIKSLKAEIEQKESLSQQQQATDIQKLRDVEDHAADLRSQLMEAEAQLKVLRDSCTTKEQTIASLRTELDEEYRRSQAEKANYELKYREVEGEVSELRQQKQTFDSNQKEKELEMETMFKEKDDEMKRLLAIGLENIKGLEDVNGALTKKLQSSEQAFEALTKKMERVHKEKSKKLEELASSCKEVETLTSLNSSLQKQLQSAENELSESKEQLAKFERELMLSTEKIMQLQSFLSEAQQDKQDLGSQLSEIRSQMNSQGLMNQQQLTDIASQLQNAATEKELMEKSQRRLEEMCKSLTAQLGGQRYEKDRAMRGLRQATAERAHLCQEARRVLAVARQWLAEHRANAMELQQLRAEREHLLKENAALRQRKGSSTAVLNPWDCGLVDREESGFWSSHWTTQLEEVNQELLNWRMADEDWEAEDDLEETACRGDTGYQSGSSK